eukprot:gb/GECG01001147.1/.p1 GENE.gb/GECG01001147.1/~~gb/GECG01001147.1/.p1  ORF type:complete len:119 (+),score=18.66 gb/GECG01001147.1/:1-357(+)
MSEHLTRNALPEPEEAEVHANEVAVEQSTERYLDYTELIDFIQRHNATKIGLQFPDSWLNDAVMIHDTLQVSVPDACPVLHKDRGGRTERMRRFHRCFFDFMDAETTAGDADGESDAE